MAPSANVRTECGLAGMMRASFLISAMSGFFCFYSSQVLFPHRPRHLELDQKAAFGGVADAGFELAEIGKIGREAIADPSDDRHLDKHPER